MIKDNQQQNYNHKQLNSLNQSSTARTLLLNQSSQNNNQQQEIQLIQRKSSLFHKININNYQHQNQKYKKGEGIQKQQKNICRISKFQYKNIVKTPQRQKQQSSDKSSSPQRQQKQLNNKNYLKKPKKQPNIKLKSSFLIQLNNNNNNPSDTISVNISQFPDRSTSAQQKHIRFKKKPSQQSSNKSFPNQSNPTSQITIQKLNQFQIKQNYDITDTTYTLINGNIPIAITIILFLLLTAIRYYSFVVCLFVIETAKLWYWIIPFGLARLIFVILVIKISLKLPQTKTQLILKTHWNSMVQSQCRQYFQFLSFSKLFTSILRSLVPAQLSFIYIKSNNKLRKYHIFTSINYIFSSIEQIVFYPFFVVFCFVLTGSDEQFSLDKDYKYATIIIVLGGMGVFILLNLFLIWKGIIIKYGGIINLFKWRFMKKKFKQDKNQSDKQIDDYYQEVQFTNTENRGFFKKNNQSKLSKSA